MLIARRESKTDTKPERYTVGENEHPYIFLGCGKKLVEVPEETSVHILKWRRIPATCILADPPSTRRIFCETYHESRRVLFQLNWNQSSEPLSHLPKSRFSGRGHAFCRIWHIVHLRLGIWCRTTLQQNANIG